MFRSCNGTCSESCHTCLNIIEEKKRRNKSIDLNEKGSVPCVFIGNGIKAEAEYNSEFSARRERAVKGNRANNT